MNNYFRNQIKRANCGLLKKVALFVTAIIRPGKLRSIWRQHANEMNRRLAADRNGVRLSYLEMYPHRVRRTYPGVL